MNNDKLTSPLQNTVLSKIKGGEVKMKSKSYFALRWLLLIVGAVLAFLLAIYLASFALFVLRVHGVLSLPKFGWPGIQPFLFSLPWLLIIAALIVLILIEVLIKRFSFSYRKPLIYSLIGIIIFVSMSALAMERTMIHHRFLQRANESNLPFFGPLYRGYKMPRLHDNAHPGEVLSIEGDDILLKTPSGEVLSVQITPETQQFPGSDIEIGDELMVLGENNNGQIKALGIRKIDGERKFLRERKEVKGIRKHR